MEPRTVVTQRGEVAELPTDYYLVKDLMRCQDGDYYYHYASKSWRLVTDTRRASEYNSAVCRHKRFFKNVVIIE